MGRSQQGPADRTLQVLTDINSSGTFDLSTLSVALREIRNLITTPETPPEEVSNRPNLGPASQRLPVRFGAFDVLASRRGLYPLPAPHPRR